MPGSVIQERRGLRDRKIRPGGKHSTRGLPRELKFEGRARRTTSGGLGKPTTAVHFHTSLLIKLPFQSDLTTDRTIRTVQMRLTNTDARFDWTRLPIIIGKFDGTDWPVVTTDAFFGN